MEKSKVNQTAQAEPKHESPRQETPPDTENESAMKAVKTTEEIAYDMYSKSPKQSAATSTQAPDGGYGWVVVIGCFISHMISGGFDRSDGVYYLEFKSRYGLSSQLTAWPGAVVSALRFMLAPVAGAVCNKYSVRTSVMIGAIFFSLGVFLNGFADDFYFLFFSFGLLQGIGRGLCSAPGLILVNQYFDRHRGLATGLATSGAGVGTFAIIPLTQYLFDHMGFQGAFLILSAIAFHMVLVAVLYRPLNLYEKVQKTKADHKKIDVSLLNAKSNTADFVPDRLDGTQTSLCDKQHDTNQCPVLELDNCNGADVIEMKAVQAVGQDTDEPKPETTKTKPNYMSTVDRTVSTATDEDSDPSEPTKTKIFHFHLLRRPPFLMFCISIMLFAVAVKAAFTFIRALAKSRGLSDTEAALILSVSGAVDTVGRIAAGVVLGLPKLKPFRPILFNGIIFLTAGVSFIVPFLETFPAYCLVCGLYGMCTGAYVSQKSVVLADTMGTETIASSLGLLVFFQGVGTLLGAPVSGALRDAFGNYDGAFFLGGFCMVVAGVVMATSNAILRRNKQ